MSVVEAITLYKTYSGPVNILGNGPSLKKARLDRLAPCIGINCSWRLRPALIHCFVDQKQLSTLTQGLLHESRYIIIPPKFQAQINKRWYRHFPNQQHVFYNAKAGFGGLYAIKVAKFLGFDTLYLHGFDGTGHLGNFIESDPQAPFRVEGQYPGLKWEAEHLEGVEIFNCTPNSDIPYFPRRTL